MVIDDFWIKRHIGSGNMCDVFVATQRSQEREVCLKVMSPAVSRSFTHDEHINFLTAVCTDEVIADSYVLSGIKMGKIKGLYYWVTPYVSGSCLDAEVRDNGSLAESVALSIVQQVAERLLACWSDYGLAHGGIRPSNLLVGEDKKVYLTDFGNAKSLLISKVNLDLMNYNGNVADYCSPEQGVDPTVSTPQSDMYSLGATLYYLLTGESPYAGSTATEVLAKHAYAPLPKRLRKKGGISPETAHFLLQMLAKDPDDRPQVWGDVIGLLRGIPSFGKQQAQVRAKTTVKFSTRRRIKTVTGGFQPPASARSITHKAITVLSVIAGILAVVLGMVLINKVRTATASTVTESWEHTTTSAGPAHQNRGGVESTLRSERTDSSSKLTKGPEPLPDRRKNNHSTVSDRSPATTDQPRRLRVSSVAPDSESSPSITEPPNTSSSEVSSVVSSSGEASRATDLPPPQDRPQALVSPRTEKSNAGRIRGNMHTPYELRSVSIDPSLSGWEIWNNAGHKSEAWWTMTKGIVSNSSRVGDEYERYRGSFLGYEGLGWTGHRVVLGMVNEHANGAGVAFCMQDFQNYYLWYFSYKEQKAVLAVCVNDEFRVLASVPMEVERSKWYAVLINRRHDKIFIVVDRKRLITVTDRTFSGGTFALFAQSGLEGEPAEREVKFRNIRMSHKR